MNKKNWKRLLIMFLVITLGMSCRVFAANDEVDNDEQVEYIEGEFNEPLDQYVDGIYNTSINCRASLAGMVRLGQSGTKLLGNYSTSYTYSVDRIGVKNVKLQYKGSLGLWHNIITIDDRYITDKSVYSGAFSCDGVIGRIYRLKCTHYITDNGNTESRNNETENLTFR